MFSILIQRRGPPDIQGNNFSGLVSNMLCDALNDHSPYKHNSHQAYPDLINASAKVDGKLAGLEIKSTIQIGKGGESHNGDSGWHLIACFQIEEKAGTHDGNGASGNSSNSGDGLAIAGCRPDGRRTLRSAYGLTTCGLSKRKACSARNESAVSKKSASNGAAENATDGGRPGCATRFWRGVPGHFSLARAPRLRCNSQRHGEAPTAEDEGNRARCGAAGFAREEAAE